METRRISALRGPTDLKHSSKQKAIIASFCRGLDRRIGRATVFEGIGAQLTKRRALPFAAAQRYADGWAAVRSR